MKSSRLVSSFLPSAFVKYRSFQNICVPEKKRGIVIGVYDTPCPGEYNLTPTGQKLNSESDDKIMKYLKKCELTVGSPPLLLNDICPEVHAVAVASLGREDAGRSDSECLDECRENVRVAAGLGARALQENDVEEILVEGFGLPEVAAEGAALATWSFQELKDRENRAPVPTLELYNDTDRESWCQGMEMASAQNLSRKLEETPANIIKPHVFSQMALEALCAAGVHVDVRDTAWLHEKKLCALLATARGSCESPLLLEMSYCGGFEGDKPIVLIGKGVTFDSGGLDLKSHRKMVREGVLGMAGAAVVVGIMKGLAALKIPINVNAVVGLCENMPGGMAMRPGDVVLSHSGRSVLIERTENEGEVILADLISFSEAFNPCLVTTLAAFCHTLIETLGAPASAAFTSSNSCWMELVRAAATTGDRVWRMPLWKAYSNYITKHQAVDVTNVGVYPGGDPCTAAAFLKEFSPCCDFIHVDIAGTGGVTYDDSIPYLQRGLRTGRPTRTVIQFLRQLVCPQCKNGL